MKHIFFTIPKAFDNPFFSKIQNNAIQSWKFLTERNNIILFGNDPGVKDFAQNNNLTHIPDIRLSNSGTPSLTHAFEIVQKDFPADLYTYINADIILTPNYQNIINNIVNNFNEFLSVGCRYNVNIDFDIDFNSPNWANDIITFAHQNGQINNTTWTDYFTFTPNFFENLPEFIAGRPIFDIYFLTYAIMNAKNSIDLTDVNTAIHQNHEYSHKKFRKNEVWYGKESYFNHQNAGKYYYLGNIKYCKYKYFKDGIKLIWEINGYKSYEHFLNFALFETATDLVLNAKYDKAIEMYEYLESKNFDEKNFFFSYALALLNIGETEKAINYFLKELEKYPENNNAAITLNQIKNFKLFNINLSAIIYGFENFQNIEKLIDNLINQGITSIYLISNNYDIVLSKNVILIESTPNNLALSLNKIIKNSELNDHILLINGDLFNVANDFFEKLKAVYQPYNFAHAFYFNSLLINSKNEIEGFYQNRDYFYEHNQMLYYHLVSNKILFDCVVFQKQIFKWILFDINNDKFIHKFWIQFFKLHLVTKLVPYYVTYVPAEEYIDLSLRLEHDNSYNTIENYYYIFETMKLKEIFPHLDLENKNSKNFGDIALFLFNLFFSKQLYKAAISIVTQISAYTQNLDILNICIKPLIENFDLKLLKNILLEFQYLFNKEMSDKLLSYINEHIELSQSIFDKSSKFDKIIKLNF
ncbi:MAG TPA: hypothetical protein PK088_09320 [Ignavibacteriales bacterium]|nr:hypothetical protein [Ignavibacteriales bacterium]